MRQSTITYRGIWDDVEVVLPINYRDWNREEGCKDIILKRALAHNCPLMVYAQITTDGRVKLALTRWEMNDNQYWHIHSAPDRYNRETCKMEYVSISDAQATTLALIFANKVPPELVDESMPRSLLHGLGATPQELLSDRGGVLAILDKMNIKVYVTRPCRDEDEEAAEEDRIARQEAELEVACEDGRLPGAMPADL